MSRPKTKKSLIILANQNFEKLWEVIDGFTKEEFNTEFNFPKDLDKKAKHRKRDKNVRDILIHLYEWHQLLLNWICENIKGKLTNFLPDPYNWKNYGNMNIKFWEKHQKTSYEESVSILKNSHNEIVKKIQLFSDEELFTKKFFSWTGTTSLGSYCISATSSHYDWAVKKLKKHKKSFK